MTPQKLVVQSLSALVAEKRQRLECLGMMGVSGDEAEKMRQSMAYSQAQSELWNAQNALAAAISQESHKP